MPMIIGKDKSHPKMIASILASYKPREMESETVDPREAGMAAASELINAVQQGNASKVFEMCKALYDICDSMEDAAEEME